MKLTTFLLIVSLFQIHANSYSQNKKISLKLNNATVEKVFNEIESLSKFHFLYNHDKVDLNRKISINVEKKRIGDILKSLFLDTDVYFVVKKKSIILKTGKNKNLKTVVKKTEIQQQITGTVSDVNGEPLPGASILEKGTKNGVQSDFDGNFSIEVSDENATLVISYIGFATQEIPISGQSELTIVLKEDAAGLDEVVVVGYTASEKRKLTTSVAVVKTVEIAEAPYTNVVSGLQGRVPGLFVNQSGGSPGTVASVSIRGGGEPLYVIDGIIADKDQFVNLAPDDIESVSVLKDAASATTFGFGASNGVIQVVTKSGKGKLTVSYNYDSSFSRPTYLPDNVSPEEYFQYRRDGHFNSGLVPPDPPTGEIQGHKNILKEVLDLATPQQRHSISLSGGTKAGTKIYASVGTYREDINIISSDYGLKRYTFQTKIFHEFKKSGIGIGANIALQKSTNTSSPNSYFSIFSNLRYRIASPFYLPSDPDKYYQRGNPLAQADPAAGKNTNENNLVNTQLSLQWKVPQVEGLIFRALGNFRHRNYFNKVWKANADGQAQAYDLQGNAVVATTGNGGPSLSERFSRSNSLSLQMFIDYKRSFGLHGIDFTGGYVFTNGVYDAFGAFRRDYVTPAIEQLNQGGLANQSNSGSGSSSATEGYVATLKYDFDSKYILTLGGRYDGFYGFAPGEKYGFFPAVSAAWNAHKEEFLMPLLDKAKINEIKVHASWGETGTPGGTFSYLSNYKFSTPGYYNGSSYEAAVYEGGLPPVGSAPTWQTTTNIDIGVDVNMFNKKLNLGYNWFKYKNTGYLRAPAGKYSTTLGTSLPVENTDSEFRRGGLEFFANYKGESGSFKYHIGGNLTTYKTFWVKKFDEAESSYKNPRTRIAQVVNAGNYGGSRFVNTGFYQNTSDIINNPRLNGTNQLYPGYIAYKDINGDGLVDGNDQIRQNIPTSPLLTYGIDFGISYKALSLEGLLQGSGRKSINLGFIWQSQTEGAIYPIRLNTWTPDNRNAEFPLATSANVQNNTANSDFWLKDAKYLRLKSLSLKYDLLKTSIFNKNDKGSSLFSSFSIILSGTNIVTFSNISKYFIDPEEASSSLWSYPVPKTYSIGLRIGL